MLSLSLSPGALSGAGVEPEQQTRGLCIPAIDWLQPLVYKDYMMISVGNNMIWHSVWHSQTYSAASRRAGEGLAHG